MIVLQCHNQCRADVQECEGWWLLWCHSSVVMQGTDRSPEFNSQQRLAIYIPLIHLTSETDSAHSLVKDDPWTESLYKIRWVGAPLTVAAFHHERALVAMYANSYSCNAFKSVTLAVLTAM